jgi:hypothetical protein
MRPTIGATPGRAHVVAGRFHGRDDFGGVVEAADPSQRPSEPAGYNAVAAVEQPPEQLRSVAQTGQHDTGFDGIDSEERLRYSDECHFRCEHPQAVAYHQVGGGRHLRLFEVI